MAAETAPRPLRWFDHIFININWFSLTLRAQVLGGLLVPLLVQNFVGEAQKGSYFGAIRLWALMVALLAQAMFGLLSDRSRSRWGRRRPFIFAGAVLEVVVIMGMLWIAGLQGLIGYTVLFIAYIVSMILANMSQAGTQGLMPDVVPHEKRGITSGVKMLLEIPLPLVVVGLVIALLVYRSGPLGDLGLYCTRPAMVATRASHRGRGTARGTALLLLRGPAIRRRCGVAPSASLVADGAQYSVAAASPREVAQILDAIFRHHFGLRPFADEGVDYAVGAEW